MTEPFNNAPTETITVTTNLLSEPAYAEVLGHICVGWANLEWGMYNLFEAMSGAPPAIARSIFYSTESNRGRRDIISNLAKTMLQSRNEQADLVELMQRVGRCAATRNKFVHDTWGVASTQKHEIFQLRMSRATEVARMEQVTLNDMRAVTENIRKLTEEIYEVRKKLEPRLPEIIKKFRSLPGVGLTYAPKGHPPGRKPKGVRSQK